MALENKDTLLSRMKKAKSFLDEAPKEKKELKPQQISITKPAEEAQQEMKPQTSTVVYPTILTVRGVLYRQHEEEWQEVTEGRLQARNITGKGIQLLFILDNTRIIMNMLITHSSQLLCKSNTLIFTGVEQSAQQYTGGIRLKTEEEAESAEKALKDALEEQKSAKE
ncbi:hypothetical protein NEMIN01_1423 [Nematocida minor]|uniref:uncharacterized protein n=1 Tax=Nematocida minor TaxID=1912983 RepID=UPI00221F5746|nr:uncharacterized protein NEMIN01_1423 [Nematocida minor]KAI5191215.1 hypothetical protein NEMIN01_1423 [Nematocida minor]